MVAKISEILTRAPSLNSCSRWLLGSSGKRIGNEVESIDEEKTPFRQDLFRLTYLTKKGAFFFPSCQLVLSLSQHRALSIHKPWTFAVDVPINAHWSSGSKHSLDVYQGL